MSSTQIDGSHAAHSPLVAWRNAMGVLLLLWATVGLPCFGLLAQWLAVMARDDLLFASFLLDCGFAIATAVVVLAVVGWQRAHGETIRDLGWGRPTRRLAVVLAVLYAAGWVALSYARGGNPLAVSWERPVMAVVGVWLAFGEELAIRGFFLESLRRGGVPAWLQVVASALAMGSYHGVVGLHYSFFYAASAAVLFGGVSLLFLLGRRSLLPGLVAHSLVHVLGDPVLTMGILRGVLAFH